MINYAEYLNLNGLVFKIGFDVDNDDRIIFGVDYCDMPIFYDYWGQGMSFIEEL